VGRLTSHRFCHDGRSTCGSADAHTDRKGRGNPLSPRPFRRSERLTPTKTVQTICYLTNLLSEGGTVEEQNLFNLKDTNGVPAETVQAVFDFWKNTCNRTEGTKLDEAREKKIASALKLYGEETCRQAIIGCTLSEWHNGRNPRNKKYNDITLIFRNADKVETFVALYHQEKDGQKEMDEWLNM